MIDLVTYKHNFFTSVHDIIEVPVSKEMAADCQAKTHKGAMNSNSMMKGERNFEGVLGEEAAHIYLPMLINETFLGGTFNGDYDFRYGIHTIDVKNKHFENVQDKDELCRFHIMNLAFSRTMRKKMWGFTSLQPLLQIEKLYFLRGGCVNRT